MSDIEGNVIALHVNAFKIQGIQRLNLVIAILERCFERFRSRI